MKILISGSSGFIGSALCSFLAENGHHILKLVRVRANLKADEIGWDLDRGVIDPGLLEGLDAVIHLAGENISGGRWTPEKKKRIRDSRVRGTYLLCTALAGLKQPPKTFLGGSAIGFYGSRGDEILTEKSSKGTGFLADVCSEWEGAAQPATEKGIRVVNLRFGAVLHPKGGVLKQILPLFKWGLGGCLGSGRQYMSWVAMEDVLNGIDFLLAKEGVEGPVNMVAPNVVTNEEFTKKLAKVLHRPAFMHVPEFMIKFLLGEMGEELLLGSTRAVPKELFEAGYEFDYPHLEEALSDVLG